MPFPIVSGLPKNMSDEGLEALREKLVSVIASRMNCPPAWVHPILNKDILDKPTKAAQGSSTILIKLETGLFYNLDSCDPRINATLNAIAEVVWEILCGQYEVEIAVSEWIPGKKFLIEAKE